MKNIITAVLFLIVLNSNAAITGRAFLEGQTNHSGIKVKFIPQSPTAKLDSTTTDDAGNYSMSTPGGVYKVEFSKNGYQYYFYNNNVAVAIASDEKLLDVTLLAGNMVLVSGDVSGIWKSSNTYRVTADINIPKLKSLTIEPGTKILFNGSFDLTVNGKLNAVGTEADTIIWTTYNSAPKKGDWKGIIFAENSVHDSKIIYSKLEYAETAITLLDNNIELQHSKISNFKSYGIVMYNNYDNEYGDSKIMYNTFCDFKSTESAYAILSNGGNSEISCNHIYNGYGSAIMPNGNNEISNNVIHDITGTYGAIHKHDDTSTIKNNYIYNCSNGIYIGGGTGFPVAFILNNTIINCQGPGILFSNYHAECTVKNNIIANNITGIEQVTYSGGSTTPKEISYNLLFNNGTDYKDVQIIGLGKIVSNNTNGDPIDSYFNLGMAPLFKNDVPPQLSDNSPAIHAGSNDSTMGIYLNDFCTILTSVSPAIQEQKEIKIYPNPSSQSIYLDILDNENTEGKVHIYNLFGEEVLSIGVAPENLLLDISSFSSGQYFGKIIFKNKVMNFRFIKI